MNRYMQLRESFTTWDLHNKRVFLRADLNTPIVESHIASTYKLDALRPTLDYLIAHDAQITVATHIGRPTSPDASLSTTVLRNWFVNNGYSDHLARKQLIILENLRFNPGEYTQDHAFAQQLAANH